MEGTDVGDLEMRHCIYQISCKIRGAEFCSAKELYIILTFGYKI